MFVCDNRQKEEIEVRAFLVGRRPCRGVPVDYFLLVEEWDALWECYGIRVESGGERTEIPGITASQSGILSLLSKLMRNLRISLYVVPIKLCTYLEPINKG